MRVERSIRIDVQVTLPVETGALIANTDLDPAVQSVEGDLGLLGHVLGHRQAPLHLGDPVSVRV